MKLIVVCFLLVAIYCVLTTAKALNDDHDDADQAIDLLRRVTRQTAKQAVPAGRACKYQKGPWSACDPQTRKRTRTLSLKKGPKPDCEEVKVLSKECGKGKRQKQKNNTKNRDRQRQNKKQDKATRNKQQV